ncbi:hypothetical protein GK047_14970 [Paenibacillus sp. SYP-B3998]|uniref:Uncharacterized protein n=1 Tax=Paenibacillus sp. SYP-B3998 TaxID=2678564 RepID=A0A6G4A0Y4_9BACL|nr:hypothetical protein [Paenibacillus sp. SYP-B3998]NEW07307.1 hypothetical protein [Paenibacillus sp. SYP-B3998]
MLGATLIIKIITSSIVVAMISTFFKLGVWSQIASSKFLEKYDSKEELLFKARSDLFVIKDNIPKGIFNTLPFLLWHVVLYLILAVLSDSGYLPVILTAPQLSNYLFVPIMFVLFHPGYLFFALDIKRVDVNQGKIKYEHPVWFSYAISLIVIGVMLTDVYVSPAIKQKIMGYLQITSEQDGNLSLVYVICSWISRYLVLKPVTRWIVQYEDYRLTERSKEVKNDQTSIYGVAGLLFSIVLVFTGTFVTLSGAVTNLIPPIGDLINLYCFILLGAVLAGQRSKYLEISRSCYKVKGQLFYKNIKGEKVKIKPDPPKSRK